MADLSKSGKAAIEGDEIVIRVAISALPMVVEQSPFLFGVRVTDATGFASELVDVLNETEPSNCGTVHHAFDSAICRAVDAGSEHVATDATAEID